MCVLTTYSGPSFWRDALYRRLERGSAEP